MSRWLDSSVTVNLPADPRIAGSNPAKGKYYYYDEDEWLFIYLVLNVCENLWKHIFFKHYV